MTTKGVSHVTAFAASVALSAADGAPAMVMNADGSGIQRVRLIPMGEFTTRGKGRFVVANLAAAQAIVELSRHYAATDDIAVDYDHQTVFGAIPGVGGRAEASGWIKPTTLSAERDGIFGDIHWTKDAAELINARKYRYLSPNIAYDEKTGQVFALLNAGLTNTPAIVGLTKLAASASLNPQDLTQELTMDLTALAASLNLPATATLVEIVAAQQAQAVALSAAQGNVAALNQALGLDGAADHATALSTAAALKTAPVAGAGQIVVPTEMLTGMQTQLSALTTENITGKVDAAISSGRIIPEQRDHYIGLMRTNPTAAAALMASNPVVVAGELLTGQPAAAVTALSATQKEVCAVLGLNEAEFLKSLQETV